MTALPSDVARRHPANAVQTQPTPKVISGQTVTRRHPGRVAAWTFTLLLIAFLFGGFLLSML